MKQKLALARAMIHQPELLFLDEPTSGLDPVITRQVHDLIRELSKNEKHTVFLCTHNLAEAQRLCDRVAVLEQGKMVALGSPSELARDLWKGVHLSFTTTPEAVPTAIQTLTGFPAAQEVTTNKEYPVISLTLILRDQIPEMVAKLMEAGVPLYQLTPKEPTLEDIYFALHEGSQEVN